MRFAPPRPAALVAALALVALAPDAFAAPPKADASRGGGLIRVATSGEEQAVKPAWLYVIGINAYEREQPLKTAVADARAFKDLMLEKFQFTPDRVLERYDREATKANIFKDLSRLARTVGPDDAVVIYYAGHGVTTDIFGDGWVPVDGAGSDAASLVTNDNVKNVLSGLKARHVWLISDSCFSGTLLSQRSTLPDITERFFLEKYRTKSRAVFTSGGNEPVADASGARDCHGHSVFACYLLKKLRAVSDPYVTPDQFAPDVAKVVSNNSVQTPMFGALKQAGDEGGSFVLVNRKVSGAPSSASTASVGLPAVTVDVSDYASLANDAAADRARAERMEQAWGFVAAVAADGKVAADKRIAALEKFERDFGSSTPYAGEVSRLREAARRPVQVAQVSNGAGAGDMVVVPAGEFLMGCNEGVDSQCEKDEKPGRNVFVSEFRIDATEVTVAAYAQCVDAGSCSDDGLTMPYWGDKDQPDWKDYCNWGKRGREQHPVNCVSWPMAVNYCRWAGKRLPTEAEWEKAARGTDGRKYSWGNRGYASQTTPVANIADESGKRGDSRFSTIAEGYDDGFVGTAPVGRFPSGKSPYGALDMIGNVWEWVSDWYAEGYSGPTRDPEGPSSGQYRVLRGGSWFDSPAVARASNRNGYLPGFRLEDFGFRCAQ